MDFLISTYRPSNKTRSDLVTWIRQKDFYNINKSLRAFYRIVLKSGDVLEDEDGLFVILSAILICLHKLDAGKNCSLVMSDSPPTLSFKVLDDSQIMVQLNSYGTVNYEEKFERNDVEALLREKRDECVSAVKSSTDLQDPDLEDLLYAMNPDFLGKLQTAYR